MDTIKLLKVALNKSIRTPDYFHTDHGVEYANQYVTNFLTENNIEQSMSPKGNSLANRPSEFF
jgi:transposase InsO family protein